ncbi:hypothetical protein [Acinetobacter variabilis]|uniref:hypothetical protein n=1 Tax=Acinetobacter variabilis TaxID=70346 RepID=UPI0021C21CEF|nr:hypothetical protein [Acinetobacter variabilis]UXI52651.1 hypothetical protein N5980_06845 [Acinetobacter variabilis]
MNTKVDEGKLISGKEALDAWYEGLEIEVKHSSTGWFVFNDHNFGITVFKSEDHQFRLKPRTITINGIEVPSIKKESAIYRSNDTVAIVCESFEEAELMCLALRQVFGGSHDN